MANILSGLLGAGMGWLTGGPAGAIAGGIGGLTANGKPAQRTSQQAAAAAAAQGQLSNMGSLLQQRYQSATPGEQSVLNYFMQRAGLGAGGNVANGVGLGGVSSLFGGHPGGPGTGTAPGVNGGMPFGGFGSRRGLPGFQGSPAPAGTPGLVNGNLGIYNSPQYQLLRQQAEEDIGRNMENNQLGFNAQMADRGIDRSSVQQGGQAAITAGANKSYADFARNLAMQAADKQDQLVGQFSNAQQPALNAGAAAGGMFGQAAGLGQAGQQINQAQSNTQSNALGSAIGAAAKLWGLGGHGGAGNQSDGGAGDTSGVDQSPGFIPSDTAWMQAAAHGGPVAAGQPVLVGDDGGAGPQPEAFVPAGGKPHTTAIPTAMLSQVINHLLAHSNMAAGCASMPARAHGGPVQQGQPTLVGERGPEAYVVGSRGPAVFTPPQNGYILPNPATPPAAPVHPLAAYLQALTHLQGC